MKKRTAQITAIILSVFVFLCSAACTGCSSAAELSVSLEATAERLDAECYYADDGQLLLTVNRDRVIFSGGEPGIAELAENDLQLFVYDRDSIDGNEYGDVGLAVYLKQEQEEYQQTGAENYIPRIFDRSCMITRADDAVISISFAEISYKDGTDLLGSGSDFTVYSINYDAKTGQRLTLDNIALNGIDFASYARDYITAFRSDNYSGILSYGDEDEWIENYICCDGMWYFTSDGLTFECRTSADTRFDYDDFSVTIPYTELVKVIKSEYIPETASMGLEPFGEGLLGGDDVASVAGTIVSVDGNKLTVACEDGSKAVLLLADNDNKEYAGELIGCEVEVVYYTVTNEVAAITAAE